MTHAAFTALAPKVSRLIRDDHAAILAIFRRYTADAPTHVRQGLAERIAIALEIHAKLEEEVFYPALRELYPDHEVLQKSVPEHNEMRRLIGRLRRMRAQDVGFDAAVLDLMRHFIHHMADEETVLVPAAERVLADYLGELGGRMRRRRHELTRPRMGAIATNLVRSVPLSSFAAVGAAFGLGLLVAAAVQRSGSDD